MLKPTGEQEAILKAAREETTSIMIGAYAGTGKALRNDQRVMTPTGYVPIGMLHVGDKVVGKDGNTYSVKGVFPQGVRKLFEVKLSDNTAVIADADHLWRVRRADGKWFTVSTEYLRARPRMKSGPNAGWGDGTRGYWFFPLCAPIQFDDQPVLEIDPYLLGVLLGDGCFQEHSVSFSSADPSLVEEVSVIIAADFGLVVKKSSINNNYDYRITTNPSFVQTRKGIPGYHNPLLTAVRALGISALKSQYKFIPGSYKKSSVENRISILQGLFDTDGSAGPNCIDYSSSSYSLACDVKFIVETLGGTATIQEKQTTGLVSYRLYIKLPKDIKPFRLQRKMSKYLKKGIAPVRVLVSIIEVAPAEATCISVDSPDSLFLTENCLVTHNTSTLKMLMDALPPRPSLAVAFNVRISEALAKVAPPHFIIKTFNSLGHTAWAKAIGRRPNVDERKLGKIVSELFKSQSYQGSEDDWDTVRRMAENAMHAGLIPKDFKHYYQNTLVPDNFETWERIAEDVSWSGVSQQLIDFAREAIIENIKQGFAGVISYDDQIYLSVLFGGRYDKFPLVLLDEAQDIAKLNREQIRKLASDRLIVVGDSKQAIYAFRGADSESIAQLRGLRLEWIDLPLTTTFRCPKIIVARNVSHAPGFNAFSTAPEGRAILWKFPQGQQLTWLGGQHEGWNWSWVQDLAAEDPIAILCRNNAPLLGIAFKLLRQGVGVTMLGRDIGKNLTTLSKKIAKDDFIPMPKLVELINNWRKSEIELAQANKKLHLLSGIEDRAECLLAVIESGVKNAGDLRAKLSTLFSRTSGMVTLSTGHRAKGLEWPTVLHLDPWRIPSKYALKDEKQMTQELNLSYVIETRTKQTYIEADLANFQPS